MTIAQSATFIGLPVDDVRPFARTRQLQQILTINKDQARVWEGTTGLKVPPSSGAHAIAATPHAHTGTSGVVIPIPLIQQVIGARLAESLAPSGGWKPFHEPIVRIPKGVSKLRVLLTGDDGILHNVRVRTKDTSLAVLETGAFLRAMERPTVSSAADMGGGLIASGAAGVQVYYCDLDVTADTYVIVSLQYPDVNMTDWGAVHPAIVDMFAVLPWVGAPYRVAPWNPALINQPAVKVPNADHHLEGTADAAPYISIDSAMTTDGYPVSSYLCHAIASNDPLLAELATGAPASGHVIGHTSNTHWKGHNHGDDLTAYTTDMLGVDIDQTLLAISWGVGRNRPISAVESTGIDQVNILNDVWDGGIFGPCCITTRTTFADVGRYRFRMPSATSANIQAGLKIKCAVYGYADVTTMGGNMECRLSIYNDDGSSGGTATTLTWSADGRAVQTGTLDWYGASGSGVGGADAFVLVELRKTTVVSTPSTLLYSMVLWYEES